MNILHALAAAALVSSSLAAIAAERSGGPPPGAAVARPAGGQAPASANAQIYQQRLPDGSVVLTDQPFDGARVQRMWDVPREDPVAATRRREQVREEAQAVSERVDRRIQRQQADLEQSESHRLRARLAEARRETDAERQAAANRPTIVQVAPQPQSLPLYAAERSPGSIQWSESNRRASRQPVSPTQATPLPRSGAADPAAPAKKRRHTGAESS